MARIELQDFVQFGQLFEVYGKLLSDDRQKIMVSYFEFNMTLAEIAQERCISRQAVLDAILKSCQKLRSLEDALGIVAKRQKLSNGLTEILETARRNGQTEIVTKVEKILKEI